MGFWAWLFGKGETRLETPLPPLAPIDFASFRALRKDGPVKEATAPLVTITVVSDDSWVPPPPDTVLQIVSPVLPGRRKLHQLGEHQCMLEYETSTGKALKRQIILLDARNAFYSVLVRAYTVGGPKSAVAEYRVHRMKSITGRDGVAHDPIAYFRDQFGLEIR